MLDISAVEFKQIKDHILVDFIYYIKEDKIYRSTDILDASEPGCSIVSLEYVMDLIPKWNMCRMFRSSGISSFIDSWNNRRSMIYSRISDFCLIKGKISNIEKLYNRLEKEMPEVIKINNNMNRLRRYYSDKTTIAELKDLAKLSIYKSNIDLFYYFPEHEIVKTDNDIFYYSWFDYKHKKEIYYYICHVLEMNVNSSNFKIIDSHLNDNDRVVCRILLNPYAQLIQLKLLEEIK